MMDGATDKAEPVPVSVAEDLAASPATGAEANDAFKLRRDPPKVMRLSRKALAAIGAFAGLSIGGALLYALRPVTHDQTENLIDTEAVNKPDALIGAPAEYTNVPRLGPPLPGDLGRPILSARAKGRDAPATSSGSAAQAGYASHSTLAAQAEERRSQERNSARVSQIFVGSAAPAGPQTIAAIADTAPASVPAPENSNDSAQTGQTAFLKIKPDGVAMSTARISAPASPNVLQAGSIIPAALITAIRSDLPGQITAQVTQNVYDSPTGRILLIPQGSRLVGEYDSAVAAGQTRVLLAWDRLIFPDGNSILLDRLPGADTAGMAGLTDSVDYNWGGIFKAALVSTMLGVGTQLATQSDNDLVAALRYGTQDTVNQTGRALVQRQAGLSPTLSIRSGYPVRVLVTRDLVLDPAEGGY
ncbi:conjugal transfer protein TraI [Novosphingobium sp. P6W]|nr:conjugal transfer protein TraI [Novosphingobium sp. P6W]KIS30817.1 conjugal transfer protein TraI [Novosphingobium sp. P6W]